ncbi:MAG: response regulator transcription factor [Gammaproteobacteria bacterium]|nr:response regulator transcription factor [Gammaproteobacteria bacterium]
MNSTTRLLIADDHPLLRDGIAARLSEEPGIDVVGQASNGHEALDQARVLKPDIVLMDIAMPVMDGLEATRRFRTELPGIRVLILSMHDETEYIAKIIQAGAAGYVLKDVAAAELLRAIATVRGGGHYFSAGVNVFSAAASSSGPLSEREDEILKLIAQGQGNKEIARNLNLSVRTVETHRQNIRAKLDINTTAGLTQYAIKHGLI